jgi:hypothetical protein
MLLLILPGAHDKSPEPPAREFTDNACLFGNVAGEAAFRSGICAASELDRRKKGHRCERYRWD